VVCEELHYSTLVLNGKSKEKLNVNGSMKETSALKGSKPTTTENSQVKFVSSLQFPLKMNDYLNRLVAAK